MIHEDPVCAEPKLFVGGLRFDVQREEVFNHFAQYGPIRTCVLLKHQDTGKSKGCAMVLYTKWAHAEAAVNAENGTASPLSGPRQLIVKFADPQRRQEDGVLVGVTPKKLFVGQVAKGVTNEQIRGIFSPYGEIVDLNVMPPKKEGSMGCAFVTFSSWAAAENAIEGVDGKFTLPGAQNPIAVKMADAKPQDIQRVGGKRGMSDMMGGSNKRQFMGQGMSYAAKGGMGGGMGYGMGGMGNMGMGMGTMGMGNMGNMGMGGMGMGMGGMGYGGGMGMGSMGMGNMGMGNMGMGNMGMGNMGNMGMGSQGMGGQGMGGQGMGMQGGQGMGMQGGQGMGMQGGQGNMGYGSQGMGYSGQGNQGANMAGQGGMQGSNLSGPMSGGAAGATQQGGMGADGTGYGTEATGYGASAADGMSQQGGGMMQQGGMGGNMGGMGGMGAGNMGMGGGMGGMGGMGNQMGMGSQGMMQGGMGGMGMVGGQTGGQPGPMGVGGAGLAAAKAGWKLFIGQISFNMAEPDLYPFFSNFGTILELVLLRNPDGRNKGCGFLTYSNQSEAEAAIASGNGAVLPNDTRGRPIMVRYANQKMAQ